MSGKVARISRQATLRRGARGERRFDAPLPRFAIDQEAEVAIAAGGSVARRAGRALVENAGSRARS
jgi:hypothetical protein